MTNPHEFEVNSTWSGALTHLEFFFGLEMVKVEKLNILIEAFLSRI
jgi:hypothetical protein